MVSGKMEVSVLDESKFPYLAFKYAISGIPKITLNRSLSILNTTLGRYIIVDYILKSASGLKEKR